MKLGALALTALSSFAGTIVGNGARLLTQVWLRREQTIAAGEEPESEEVTITGVFSNTVAAATIATQLPKHQALYGFAIGAVLSAATGDVVDRWVGDAIGNMPVSDLDHEHASFEDEDGEEYEWS
jgi:hypothetical protein